MKISEMIALLQKQLEERGDVDVVLHGAYGSAEETFEVMEDKHLPKGDVLAGKLHIWTNIMTG